MCALVIRPGAALPAAPAVYAVALVPVAVDASPAVNEFAKLNELFAAAVAVGICQSVTAPLATVLNPPTKLSAELLSLEAPQASFAKISQLSLFNYIR